ncbi:tetratricopeptide repeat protein [Candidatus Latescibacterota bacterium]
MKLSRIYSWTGKFKDSVTYYDRTIKLNRENITASIEKARVLGWWGKNKHALTVYMDTFQEHPENWIKWEAEGKRRLWRGKLRSAIRCFEESLTDKPDNDEVLFDIAQSYSFVGDNEKAKTYYTRLLSANPYHTAGIKSQKKNLINVNALSLGGGFTYWDAKSFERNVNVQLESEYLTVSKKYQRITLGANCSRENFKFDDYNDMEQLSAGFSGGYDKPLVYGFGAGFTSRRIENNDVSGRDSYYVYVWYKVLENVNVNMNYVKNNMILNYRNVLNDLNDISSLMNIEYQLNESLVLGSRIKGAKINDGNRYRTSSIYSRYVIFKQPRNLYTLLEAENMRYENQSQEYFAPDNYSAFFAQLGFRHDIGRDGQYYGANRIYYDVRYKVVWDSNDEIASQPSVEVYVDINHRLNLMFNYSLTESNYYDDTVCSLQGRYLF